MHLKGITNADDISNKLQKSDLVKKVIMGTPQDIAKELMSFKIKAVREKNFARRLGCFTGSCCLSLGLIAAGIVGTWYYMSSEEKELENTCFTSLLNICKQSFTDGCQLLVSDILVCVEGVEINCCSRNN